jgi:hypothetical protein
MERQGMATTGKKQKTGDTPPPTPVSKNAKTTSRRFSSENKGLTKSKPRGGAPLGNRNALKTGRHTREMREMRRRVRSLLNDSRKLLDSLGSLSAKA